MPGQFASDAFGVRLPPALLSRLRALVERVNAGRALGRTTLSEVGRAALERGLAALETEQPVETVNPLPETTKRRKRR